jgi:deferrochelatase/peroxidase EfeB
MSEGGCPFNFTRRKFLGVAGGMIAAAGVGFGAKSALDASQGLSPTPKSAIPFWGKHQGGIITPQQSHTYFAAFDITSDKREDVIAMLKKWTEASARMARGLPAEANAPEPTEGSDAFADSDDALGLPPSRLTITFGFGPGLFTKDGKDRFGLASRRPAAFVDLPKFTGDQLLDTKTGGDISVQACADDPQVAFHAVRQLARLADYTAMIKWTQAGFMATQADSSTPRNLMGFRDGSGNPSTKDKAEMDKFIWVGDEGPDWMTGGSYLVARRARIALEHWDKMKTMFQEQTIGRSKLTGAPLGSKHEMDAADLDALDKDGNPVIPENSHLRLATAATNDGAKILRRSYSYNDGVNITAERWPPWRQGIEYDAGLLFICYQRDPRTGFIKIFDKMSKFDMMNQFVTHVGGGMFACPGGARDNEYIGQGLFSV